MTDGTASTALHADRATCLALLASQPVGRLVVSAADPVVIPVNFVLIDESIVFRADATSSAASAIGMRVAFEVDQVSELERAGWSVIARGTLEDASASVEGRPELAEDLVPWASGPKDRWLMLRVHTVTGRWVRGVAHWIVDDRRGYL
jgi:nitroimidazol reductase NimA-like FMN-containing flavoprotein (pyridoxamine 5'-phosphate oxidase superfamily)